ncbi:MAG: deoxyribose-phosphate aldolase [Bacteroidales bacterium]|jgi:deoxyribose-phosphate aldolase|nr:deoxyribose-phosphate aldolase [Bacteroidales bacterium]MDD4235302.1 deoxyribose-phosphate aldolase [Bacteroidales bacterium]MDY0160749.1 deoxyribose-phosphate aldolase [Bacteroidales bacterium]
MDINNSKLTIEEVNKTIAKLKQKVSDNKTKPILTQIFNCIDLTSLNTDDTEDKILKLTQRVNKFSSNTSIPNVAAICVYPTMVSTVKKNLKVPNLNIAAVAACFPSSQTYLSIKLAECEIVLNKGANEIDIVLSVGKFLEGNYHYCTTEITMIKQLLAHNHLKVILETGILQDLNHIYNASILSLEAGADFIKTSTGKTSISATPEAVYSMCTAIKDYYNKTGEKKGIKASGGISTSEEAILYYLIVEKVLGKEWLNNKLFRFGASRLANNVLKDIDESIVF